MHEVKDTLDDDPEFDLSGVYEADDIYVVTGEKGLEQESPRERRLKKDRKTSETDKPPVIHSSVAPMDEFGSSSEKISKTLTKRSLSTMMKQGFSALISTQLRRN